VACNAKDECVPRTEKTGGLKPATSGEKTYVPPEACTWLELITQLEEEVEAEDTLGVAPGDEQKEAGADVIQDWVNLMHDFESNVLVSMHLKAGTTQVFYEEAEVGQLVRGAFFASSADEASDVRFVITSPTESKVLEHYGHEAVFHFKAKEQGAYKFTMNNPGWVKSKQCTFTVGVTATQKLASHDLDQTEMKISRVLHLANDAQAESKYLWLRERGRLDHNTWVHERVLHMAIAQFLVFIFVCGFQIYYMKGLLSDRRVL
jgi:hypothetical protein